MVFEVFARRRTNVAQLKIIIYIMSSVLQLRNAYETAMQAMETDKIVVLLKQSRCQSWRTSQIH